MNSALGQNDHDFCYILVMQFGRGHYMLLPNWPKWYSSSSYTELLGLKSVQTAKISLSHMSLESYHMNGNHRNGLTIHRNGIISWRWDHSMEMGSYHGKGIVPYHGKGVKPWKPSHTIETESYHAMIATFLTRFRCKQKYSITPKAPHTNPVSA